MRKISNFGLKLKNLIIQNQFILYLFIFFTAFFVCLWINSFPSFLDPDSFYHLKISKLIAEQGPIFDFPWLQYTVLKEYYIDHHFLYHVLAVPFIEIMGDFAGFKFYTVVLASLFVFLSYIIFKKEKIKWPEVFVLVMLCAPAFLFRISLAKATAFSLILLFFGIYFLFKRKYWLLAIISFFYVWSYGGFLLLLVMALLYALAEAIDQTFINKPLWLKLRNFIKAGRFKVYFFVFIKSLFSFENIKKITAPLAGILAGLIINPYFPQNLKFYWQQIFEIGIINYRGLVNVGGEWYPYPISQLIADSGIAIIFGIVALIFFFIFYKNQNKKSIFFFFSFLFFFVLTLKSKRYVEYFVPHLVFFSAFTFSLILEKVKLGRFLKDFKKENYVIGTVAIFVLIYTVILFPLIMAKDVYITRQTFKGGIGFQLFAGVSGYLKENAAPAEIIMHTDWSDFPMLFYQNDQNYYIMGLDPTFMYKYDPDLYNLFAEITTAQKNDNLHQIIKENFRASYFIVSQSRKSLDFNLQNDGNFIKVYEDNEVKLYKLK